MLLTLPYLDLDVLATLRWAINFVQLLNNPGDSIYSQTLLVTAQPG
jgi:hypothetical protein